MGKYAHKNATSRPGPSASLAAVNVHFKDYTVHQVSPPPEEWGVPFNVHNLQNIDVRRIDAVMRRQQPHRHVRWSVSWETLLQPALEGPQSWPVRIVQLLHQRIG